MSGNDPIERLAVELADLKAQIARNTAETLRSIAAIAKMRGDRLTRAEVCERLGIHRNTLATYIKERGFPTPCRDGKWLLAEVIEWEAGR